MVRFNDTQTPDTKPGPYYVSAMKPDGSAYWLMRGPFDRHADALDKVSETMNKAIEIDPRAQWMAWGTCRLPADLVRADPGKMNDLFIS